MTDPHGRSSIFDVVVVGSGASGLVAALVGATRGRSVCVLEKTSKLGGTSSVSGGSIWAPVNPWAFGNGGDSREDALQYLRALALGRGDDEALVTFVDSINPMLRYLRDRTGLQFTANEGHSDYQPGLAGAKTGGRTVQNGLYDSRRLGKLAGQLRSPGSHSVPLTKLERDRWGEDTPERWDWDLIEQRRRAGVVGQGMALIGELVEGCLRNGVVLRTDAPVTQLALSEGRVVGCVVGEDQESVAASNAVVLASGGFEWNDQLVSRFLSRPMSGPASPPGNTGDGTRLAMQAGAVLANMDEAWWAPVLHAQDDYDGQPHYRTTSGLRSMPGGIMVNRYGRRFANETMNYNDLGKAMGAFDSAGYEFANIPAWLIFDTTFRRRYSIGPVRPEDPTPEWITAAPSLSDLARAVGIDADGLVQEVAEFNQGASSGEDPRFHRGESAYDRYRGDATAPYRTLAPLLRPEFYAVPIHLGCIGTKGGPIIDTAARVIGAHNRPIEGLYACGNVASCVFGPGYPGAGATLAVGMTFGYLAGLDIAASASPVAAPRIP